MLARLLKRREEGEGGFTLIELLVVMIIIGILAAIAIPAFLAQRTKGYTTATKNDLKNVSIAEESYATDNNGAYVTEAGITATSTGTLETDGAKLTDGVTINATKYTGTNPDDSYCLAGVNTKGGGIWYLDSTDNVVTSTSPNAACSTAGL